MCNRDCFNCPYEDCVCDEFDERDIAETWHIDVHILKLKSEKALKSAERMRQYFQDAERHEQQLERQKQYYRAHKEEAKKTKAEWYQKHKQEVLEHQREYRAKKKAALVEVRKIT